MERPRIPTTGGSKDSSDDAPPHGMPRPQKSRPMLSVSGSGRPSGRGGAIAAMMSEVMKSITYASPTGAPSIQFPDTEEAIDTDLTPPQGTERPKLSVKKQGTSESAPKKERPILPVSKPTWMD
jgi:hypothetical protein